MVLGLVLAGGLLAALAAGCGGAGGELAGDRARSGGAGTVDDATGFAFALALKTLPRKDRRAFAVGNSFFNRNWVRAPASTTVRDGLGPTFNAQSCSSCHLHDGRGRPPTGARDAERGLLLRLSVGDPPRPLRLYGSQLQDRAIAGVAAEGRIAITRTPRRGRYGDGTPYELLVPRYAVADRAFGPLPEDVQISPRVAPGVFGVGLLEAVPERAIVGHADPADEDGDGISGRPNRVTDVRTRTAALGRFGWKANVPTVEQQNASAFSGDLGITSPVFRDENCPRGQRACARAKTGGRPEIDARKLARVTFYTRTLAVPARRDVGARATDAGERHFARLGCATCHRPELRTGDSDVAGLSDQLIRPYTDLLLHDMGPALEDGRPDALASGSEWRTAPLWGIGLVSVVNRHTRFLHDGRARNLAEAILWHGGEAHRARERFRTLPARERRELVAFLESL
ncbi:MAG: di-heme oxidoredictase family protein [Solirubrobacteraceae bacterium]|nr:di-heme oxidoredictase family protein [Solirubrobacteraceae bacterium]